jgi:hypothetical protein
MFETAFVLPKDEKADGLDIIFVGVQHIGARWATISLSSKRKRTPDCMAPLNSSNEVGSVES